MPAYDPRIGGARCDECPLREKRVGGPVPPEMHSGARVLVIGEHPNETEVDLGRPFCGNSGNDTTKAFAAAGLDRGQISWTNAVACRCPGNDMHLFLHNLEKENRRRVASNKALAKMAEERLGVVPLKKTKKKKASSKIIANTYLPPIPTPQSCCRPRLMTEIRDGNGDTVANQMGELETVSYTNIVAMGNKGYQTLVNVDDVTIGSIRGTPVVMDLADDDNLWKVDNPDSKFGPIRLQIMPSLHAAFIQHKRRWTKVFRSDINRAVRWFNGRLYWEPPDIKYTPNPNELREFLLGLRQPFWTYDVETDAKYPLIAKLRCIGFATEFKAMVVPFLGIDGFTTFYSPDEEAEIKDIIRQFFKDTTRLKVGHNAGYYDKLVVETRLGCTPVPLIDTILLHRAVDSEMPHGLAFIGSYYTDAIAWKSDHTAVNPRSDFELHKYNALDCVQTARICPPLYTGAELRNQMEVLKVDHKIQIHCAEMHRIGMWVNQELRREREKNLITEIAGHRKACQNAIGDADFNPGSYPAVRRVLFDRWGYTPDPRTGYTELGEPKTDDMVIRKFFTKLGLQEKHPAQYQFLKAVRMYRRATKHLGTYIAKLRRQNEVYHHVHGLMEDELDNEEEQQYRDRRSSDIKRVGCVLADGRIHGGWNCHVTVSGRLSSSDPMNMQNVPQKLRDVFEPQEGNVYIYADEDQLELRAVSALAKASRYLEVFHRVWKAKLNGQKIDKMDPHMDPHSATAAMIYAREWAIAGEKQKDQLRNFAKTFAYAVIYGAEIPTIHDVIISTEDFKTGVLLYANVTQRETAQKVDAWLDANPEIAQWWENVFNEYRQKGYLTEPVLGRRRDFLDGEEEVRNEVINFKPQSLGAGLVGKAMIDLVDGPLPFYKWGPTTGMVNQCHDALLFEVPLVHAKMAKNEVERAMCQTVPGLDVPFCASAKIVRNWACAPLKEAA